MEDLYPDGEVVLCSRNWDDIHPLDILVFRTSKNEILIKRVAFFTKDRHIFLVSDNEAIGATSDDFGLISEKNIIGKVILPVRCSLYTAQTVLLNRKLHMYEVSLDDSLHNINTKDYYK